MDNLKKKREVLMNHYVKPVHLGLVDNSQLYSKRLQSDSCADELTLQVDVRNGVFQSLRFEGSACVIATSSIDLWCDFLIGKSLATAQSLLNEYLSMIYKGTIPQDNLSELMIFENLHHQKGRWKCATLGAEGINDFINHAK